MNEKSVPVVCSISSDLFFGMRIKNSVEQMQMEHFWIDEQGKFDSFIEYLKINIAQGNFLILLDLSSTMDWEWMYANVKSNEKLANIPWLAYGSHVNKEILAKAKDLGVDQVMARSKFTKALPEILLDLK